MSVEKIKIDYDGYEINLINESEYSTNSTDNKIHYKKEIGRVEGFRSVTKIGIVIIQNGKEVNKGILFGYGGASGLHENSFIFKEDKLFICIDDSVMCLGLPELDLIWKSKLDEATCFEIFKYMGDFIIHGELSISRINNKGELKWEFYGPDIFSEEFKIVDNKIYATDFNRDLFIIDINTGKEIKK